MTYTSTLSFSERTTIADAKHLRSLTVLTYPHEKLVDIVLWKGLTSAYVADAWTTFVKSKDEAIQRLEVIID